jgi:hypothetical protein
MNGERRRLRGIWDNSPVLLRELLFREGSAARVLSEARNVIEPRQHTS